MPSQVNVRYEDAEWPINLKGTTTVKEIILFSLVNHGLPTMHHESFMLVDAADAELGHGNAILAGVKPGDALTLKYAPRGGGQHVGEDGPNTNTWNEGIAP